MPRKFPKKTVYGQYKQDNCVFCPRMGTQKNEQGMVVCLHHRRQTLEEIKCVCGSWLEQRSGRFGPFFSCVKCGPIDFNRGLEIKKLSLEAGLAAKNLATGNSAVTVNATASTKTQTSQSSYHDSYSEQSKERLPEAFHEGTTAQTGRRAEGKPARKETTISTNDVEYFD